MRIQVVKTMTAVAVLALVTPALAGPWTNPSGDAENFVYTNGGDLNDRFGDPFVFGDSFFFSTTFSVNASNGATDQQVDTVSFDALADPGLKFAGVRVTAIGSYAVTGGDSSVDFSGAVSMKENAGGTSLERVFSEAMTTTPAFPITSGSNTWDGEADVNVEFEFPSPHDDIHFELSNDVLAISGPSGSASMNVTFQELQITLRVIPEPASLSLMALGGLMLIRRRRA